MIVYEFIYFLGGLAFLFSCDWVQIWDVASAYEFLLTVTEWVVVHLTFCTVWIPLVTITLLLFGVFYRLRFEGNFLNFLAFAGLVLLRRLKLRRMNIGFRAAVFYCSFIFS